MSHDSLRRTARIGLGALALLIATPALAADLAYPPPDAEEPAPTRLDREERSEEQVPPPPAEECRTIVKRRIDEDGAEVVRRVRICDEAADPAPPPRPHYRPSFHDPGPPPVPPADIPFEGPPRW